MSNTWKVVCVMTVAILLAAAGEALASKGMKAIDTDQSIFAQLTGAFRDWHVWVGMLLMFGYVLLYVYTLSLAELSLVVPLSATSYLLGALSARFYLHEEIKPARWIGTLVIIAGVLIVAWSGFGDKSGE